MIIISRYEKEFQPAQKIKAFPRKIQNAFRREFGATKIGSKWQTCNGFKSNTLYGTIISLAGCVGFWNLRCHKLVRQVNKEWNIMTPDQLNAIAWGTSIIAKIIGTGFYIKAIYDYKKCK